MFALDQLTAFKCIGGNPVDNFCLDENCKSTTSARCCEQSCQCQLKHTCKQKIEGSRLVSQFIKKTSRIMNQDDPTLSLYSDLQKVLEIQKCQYQAVSSFLDYLDQEQRQLFTLSKSNNYKQITPNLIKNSFNSLQQGNRNIRNKINLFQENQYALIKQNILKSLQTIRKIWKSNSSNIQYSFTQQSNYNDIYTLLQNNKVMKMSKSLQHFVLIQPELSHYNISKVSLKIKQSKQPKNGSIICGIGFRNKIQERKFKWLNSQCDRGFYVFDTYDKKYYGNNSKTKQYNYFKMQVQDIIDIIFDPISQILIFRNKKKNIQIEQAIELSMQDKLYFIVSSDKKQTPIQIVSYYH